jgi:hypothetical protein
VEVNLNGKKLDPARLVEIKWPEEDVLLRVQAT